MWVLTSSSWTSLHSFCCCEKMFHVHCSGKVWKRWQQGGERRSGGRTAPWIHKRGSRCYLNMFFPDFCLFCGRFMWPLPEFQEAGKDSLPGGDSCLESLSLTLGARKQWRRSSSLRTWQLARRKTPPPITSTWRKILQGGGECQRVRWQKMKVASLNAPFGLFTLWSVRYQHTSERNDISHVLTLKGTQVIDIPSVMRSTSQYRTTLGHKINSAFFDERNADFDTVKKLCP